MFEEVATRGRSHRSAGQCDASERQDEEEERGLGLRAQARSHRAGDACHKGPSGQWSYRRVGSHEEAAAAAIDNGKLGLKCRSDRHTLRCNFT